MREMVLNHTSVTAPDQHTSVDWLKDIAAGMAELVLRGVVSKTLRTTQAIENIPILRISDWHLSDARQELQKQRTWEEYLFLMELVTKVPLILDIDKDIAGRFRGCQAKTLPAEDGEPLIMCAITDWVAVGFPSEPVWDNDEVTVIFEELISDGNDVVIEEASEIIDNLTRSTHARPIFERHRQAFHPFPNSESLWNAREGAFVNLVFAPEVKHRLDSLNYIAWTKVANALYQMESGNLSNVKGVSEGVSEFRIRFGPGYRIYFGYEGNTLIILSCGTKQTQSQDIQDARDLWQNYKRA